MSFNDFIKGNLREPVQEYPNSVLNAVHNPLVSVQISTYNHSPYIRECLEGVLMQNVDFPWEICIGEDESNDRTRDICIEYAEAYPDLIRLFLHKRVNNVYIDNKPSYKFQFIYTLSKCRGKYIALCEGDDYWIDKDKIVKQLKIFDRESKASLVFTKRLVEGSSDPMLKSNVVKEKDKILYYSTGDVLKGSTFYTQTILMRNLNGLADFISSNLDIHGDQAISFYCSIFGKIIQIPDITAVHRRTGFGISSQFSCGDRLKLSHKKSLTLNQKFSTENDINFKKRIARASALFCLEKIQYKEKWKYLKYYFSERCFSKKYFFLYLILFAFAKPAKKVFDEIVKYFKNLNLYT